MVHHDATSRTDMQRALEHRITERTWGRIQGLRVSLNDDRIVVSGYTTTYHAKQLALEATLEWLGALTCRSLELNIVVLPPTLRHAAGRNWQ